MGGLIVPWCRFVVGEDWKICGERGVWSVGAPLVLFVLPLGRICCTLMVFGMARLYTLVAIFEYGL